MAVTENDLVVGPLVPANGVEVISLDFSFENKLWLDVYKTGSETPLVLDTDYTVTGEGTSNGTIVLTTAANGTDSYSVYLVLPLERSSDLQQRGELKSGPLNLEFDRLWQAMQGVKSALGRKLEISRTSTAVAALFSESTAGRANRSLQFTSDGLGLEIGPTSDDIANAQGYATAAGQSATNAQTSATNAAASEAAAAQYAASPTLDDGTVSAPSFKFTSDTNTGLYRAGDDDFRAVAGGVFGWNIKHFGVAGNANANMGIGTAAIQTSKVLIKSEDADASNSSGIGSTLQVQRTSRAPVGETNPKALRVSYTVEDGAEENSKPWAISGEMEYNGTNNTSGEGGTAVSGVTNKNGTGAGACFGGHFQVKDHTNEATTGGIIGAEINIQANGADTNENRVGVDLIARTNTEVSGGAAGEFHAGLRVRNSAGGVSGKWVNGILIEDGTQATLNGISLSNSPGTGGRGIKDAGTKDVGLDLTGTYAGAAASIPSDSRLQLGEQGGQRVGVKYDSTDQSVLFSVGATDKLEIGMGAGMIKATNGFETANDTDWRFGFSGGQGVKAQYNSTDNALDILKGATVKQRVNMADLSADGDTSLAIEIKDGATSTLQAVKAGPQILGGAGKRPLITVDPDGEATDDDGKLLVAGLQANVQSTYWIDQFINNDAAASFVIPSNPSRLFCVLMMNLAGSYHQFALTGTLNGSSNFSLISEGTALLEFATGALTGTTGTDGKVTLSVDTSGADNLLWIENRYGSNRFFTVAAQGI